LEEPDSPLLWPLSLRRRWNSAHCGDWLESLPALFVQLIVGVLSVPQRRMVRVTVL
jgi:hypothetical protein